MQFLKLTFTFVLLCIAVGGPPPALGKGFSSDNCPDDQTFGIAKCKTRALGKNVVKQFQVCDNDDCQAQPCDLACSDAGYSNVDNSPPANGKGRLPNGNCACK